MSAKIKYIIGIDEVGRGPIAGPITICAACFKSPGNTNFLKGIKDSKHLSAKIRYDWYKKFIQAKNKKLIDFAISSVGSKTIDQKGINFATKLAIRRVLNRLNKDPKQVKILLDGLLYAPPKYLNQKTIIKGDQKEKVISCASVIAKVYRDRKMDGLSKKYPEYGFEVHKGYGTSLHRKAIKKYGLSKIHRKSFCRNLV